MPGARCARPPWVLRCDAPRPGEQPFLLAHDRVDGKHLDPKHGRGSREGRTAVTLQSPLPRRLLPPLTKRKVSNLNTLHNNPVAAVPTSLRPFNALSGEVEVDGGHFGGSIRPANLAVDRVDRRLAEHQTGKRRVVVVARERSGRTLALVTKHEAEGVEIVKRVVAPGSTVHADEASHWDALHGLYDTKRINHTVAYLVDGACTNQAESFLARLRRMVDGQHHHVSPRYLYQYATHAAWLEDHRRLDNGTLAHRALRLALAHKVSRNWKGYWQRSFAR